MKKKHPQFILAMKADTLNSLPQGLSQVSLASFVINAVPDLIIREREQLETDEAYRQILPYVCVATKDDEVTKFMTYRRNKGVGESRLAGKVSIGFGGHIDLADVAHDNSVIDLFQTIGANASRELAEELRFEGFGEGDEIAMFDNGLILDHSNEVGRVHVGVALTALVPTGAQVFSNEAELELIGWHTASELLKSDFNLEPWSRFMLESFAANGVEAEEVEPA